jgi:hypothetical protein
MYLGLYWRRHTEQLRESLECFFDAAILVKDISPPKTFRKKGRHCGIEGVIMASDHSIADQMAI